MTKFTPHLKVLAVSGSTRHEKWSEVEHADLALEAPFDTATVDLMASVLREADAGRIVLDNGYDTCDCPRK